MPEVGNPQRRIDLAQARHRLVRLIEPPGKRMAVCRSARPASPIWLLPKCPVRPASGLVIAAREEMTGTDCAMREKCERIQWAEANGARWALDRDLGFPQIKVDQ